MRRAFLAACAVVLCASSSSRPADASAFYRIDEGVSSTVTTSFSGVPFLYHGVDRWVTREPANPNPTPVSVTLRGIATRVFRIHLITYASWALDLPNGTEIGRVILHYGDGVPDQTLSLRMGETTAEWSYDRVEVVEQGCLAHSRIPGRQAWNWQTTQDSRASYTAHHYYSSFDVARGIPASLEIRVNTAAVNSETNLGSACSTPGKFNFGVSAVTLEGEDVAPGWSGVNLTWSSVGCYPETPQVLRTFACNVNSGSATMTGSFSLDGGMADFQGLEATVIGYSAADYLPDWWQLFNPGACRQAALSASPDFTTALQTQCQDPWGGLALGGIGKWGTYQTGDVPSPGYCRLQAVFAIAEPTTLLSGVEYYAFQAKVNFTKTTGTGACGGCQVPLGLMLQEIRLYDAHGAAQSITYPLQNQCIYWQAPTGFGCAVTATRNRTWGQLKSLYR